MPFNSFKNSNYSGYICNPNGYQNNSTPKAGEIPVAMQTTTPEEVALLPEFPKKITGQFVFCHQDNLNTDGIYPGKYTYKEDITPEQQAAVAMENYDPGFSKLVKKGDILVGGFNFGTGSSREQAATALKFKGIPLVLGGSFSETYKRNAINNGYLLIEVPELVTDLKNYYGTSKLTILTGKTGTVDFQNSTVEFEGKKYSISPIGKIAQELILRGGLEDWVIKQLEDEMKM